MKVGNPARRWLLVGTGTTAALVALIFVVLFLPQHFPEWIEQPATPRAKSRIVQLRFAHAPSIARAIRREFSIPDDLGEGKPGSPVVVAHEKTNCILLNALPNEFATIHRRIQDLDSSNPAKRTNDG